MSEAVSGTGKAPGSIQVIERMMSLLDALAASPDAASLKQLALATELHPSTAHRILAAMSTARFVERQDAGTYRLGIRLLELGNIVKSRINVREVATACQASQALVCSKEPLAAVLRGLGFAGLGNLIGLAAGLALPSVILMMIYGQTRIFFVMSRDGLLPEFLSKVHPKFHTPHVVTLITGVGVAIAAAFFNVGALADISNTGTLFAFIMVAIGVLILRRTQPIRPRPFRTPIVWLICPLAVAGCLLLFVNLSAWTIKVFFGWAIVGGIVYLAYGKRHSNLGRLSGGGS